MPLAAQTGLYCNATLLFQDNPIVQVKGFSVARRGDPNFSSADLSDHISYVAVKNKIDILTCVVIDPRVLKYKQGDTGNVSMVAKSAVGDADLTFAGAATVLGVEGEIQFADVESACSITFAIISDTGTSPNMTITP